MKKQKLLSVLLLAIFAIGILAVVPVLGSVTGDVSITQPDKVVPGGAIELYMTDFDSTGGTIYFFLSLDNEGEISSGDIRITSMKRADVEDEVGLAGYITIYLPTTGVPAGEYYVKVSDSKSVGYTGIIVTDETVEVITEDLPTITVDPTSGEVGDEIDVEGEDIGTDYIWADLFWDVYEDNLAIDYRGFIATESVTAGEFTHTMNVPEAYMGGHKIIVLLDTGPTTLGTFVDFEVEPSVEVVPQLATFSVLADAEQQNVTLYAHGFPEGDIDADTITYTIKDILTGSMIQTRKTYHDGVDIEDRSPGPPGTFLDSVLGTGGYGLNVTVHYAKQGVIDIGFSVDGEAFTLENALLSSKPGAEGEFKVTMDVDSGKVGDTVDFMAISFTGVTDVDLEFIDDYSYTWTALDDADANGAWRYSLTLPHMGGGPYTVYVWDITADPDRKVELSFEVLPDVDLPSSAIVGESITIDGTGFLLGAEFSKVVIGTGEVEFDPAIAVGSDGDWSSGPFAVPDTSGGGKKVTVSIEGVVDDEAISIETEITIDPDVPVKEYLEWDSVDMETEWATLSTSLFAGNPMRIEGTGFLAGESVTITFSSEYLDVEAKATITDGGTADSDGVLEAVFSVPVSEDFAITVSDWEIEIAGATATNTYTIEGVEVSAPDDTYAKLFFGLEDDGDLDLTVYVGDEVRVVGVGFSTKDLTLTFGGEEVKDVSVVEDAGVPTGFFDTTITIPELERSTTYRLEADTIADSDEVTLKSKVTLSPEKAVPGATVTAYGTGFVDDEDTDINWPGLPSLATATGDSDGSWEETFTVPEVEPGTYTITFDAEGLGADDDPELTFYVLGPLKIVSLSMPGTVYPGSTIVISVNVRDYFEAAVEGATVTGKVDTASLTFTETIAGIYDATYTVPEDAAEGTYTVTVTASKPEAGGDATASGTFYVEVKVPPEIPPPVDISPLEAAVSDLSSDVAGLSGDLSSLASDVAGLKSDIAALEEAIAAIPVVPVEWIYITAIMAVIAAIAAIAAVVAVYRKIA